MIWLTTPSAMIAIIGEKSIGPARNGRIAGVVEKALHGPERVRQLDPRRQHVEDQREHVHTRENLDETRDRSCCVEHHSPAFRGGSRFSYAWL
jgi:hypothetical protein